MDLLMDVSFRSTVHSAADRDGSWLLGTLLEQEMALRTARGETSQPPLLTRRSSAAERDSWYSPLATGRMSGASSASPAWHDLAEQSSPADRSTSGLTATLQRQDPNLSPIIVHHCSGVDTMFVQPSTLTLSPTHPSAFSLAAGRSHCTTPPNCSSALWRMRTAAPAAATASIHAGSKGVVSIFTPLRSMLLWLAAAMGWGRTHSSGVEEGSASASVAGYATPLSVAKSGSGEGQSPHPSASPQQRGLMVATAAAGGGEGGRSLNPRAILYDNFPSAVMGKDEEEVGTAGHASEVGWAEQQPVDVPMPPTCAPHGPGPVLQQPPSLPPVVRALPAAAPAAPTPTLPTCSAAPAALAKESGVGMGMAAHGTASAAQAAEAAQRIPGWLQQVPRSAGTMQQQQQQQQLGPRMQEVAGGLAPPATPSIAAAAALTRGASLSLERLVEGAFAGGAGIDGSDSTQWLTGGDAGRDLKVSTAHLVSGRFATY